MGGVEYLMYIRELAKRVEGDWDSIKADLHELRQLVLSVEVWFFSFFIVAAKRDMTNPAAVC